jgi:plasmid stabilization system protein ParE
MRQVVWSEDALIEFDSIVGYIAERDPRAATRAADRIDRTIEGLAMAPTGRRGRVPGTYEKVVSNLPYIVAYALDAAETGSEVLTILRIIHTSRAWPEGGWPNSRP